MNQSNYWKRKNYVYSVGLFTVYCCHYKYVVWKSFSKQIANKKSKSVSPKRIKVFTVFLVFGLFQEIGSYPPQDNLHYHKLINIKSKRLPSNWRNGFR